MLKNIPYLMSPDLMKLLLEMGHGDEILIADGNYPQSAINSTIVRLDGNSIPEILKVLLLFFPLDTFSEGNVFLMDNNSPEKPKIWSNYKNILDSSGEPYKIKMLERYEFYKRAGNVYCVVITSETELYANIILRKGVVTR
ncbi:MAG: RbsD/FucU domain-containing protein [Defluviitoga tunisiensis]